MTPPVALPRDGDSDETAGFVARHGGRVVAYLDEVTTPERALRGAGEAFAALRVRLAGARPDDEAVARALLSATRAAAARHAGRGPTAAAQQDALETVARLLVALHADRLDPEDATRLEVLLRDSPAARELAAAFDRAERRYATDRHAPLTGTEVGVLGTAMALADAPAAPAASDAAARRTVVPAPPTAPELEGTPDAPGAHDPPAMPDLRALPTPPREPASPEAIRADVGTPRAPFGPEDPFGPESMGYVVPRPGLPRPERGAAPVRRRRRRATAAPAQTLPAGASDADASDTAAPSAPGPDAAGSRTDAAPGTATAATPTAVASSTGRPDAAEASSTPVLVRATRGLLDNPVVRQLGVPALMLLAVLIAALVAAGAFSPKRDESVPAVPRPTIPTVPGDPRAIPPLP